MSFFGIPSELSALQATQAQKVASKAKARERGVAGQDTRRREDALELGVAGLEDGAAIRNADEEAGDESSKRRRRKPNQSGEDRDDLPPNQDSGGLDLTA